jgi:hypothetical protein
MAFHNLKLEVNLSTVYKGVVNIEPLAWPLVRIQSFDEGTPFFVQICNSFPDDFWVKAKSNATIQSGASKAASVRTYSKAADLLTLVVRHMPMVAKSY